MFLTVLLLWGLLASTAPASHAAGETPVFVIPVRTQVGEALLLLIQRGIADAELQDAAAIVLVMDTPGGAVSSASEIVRAIQGTRVPVYTFVEKDAFSAGAIIAMSTKAIFMAPGAVIGDALPVMMSPMGKIELLAESAEEKLVSSVAALIRSAAQQAGHDPELAEKMVRREIVFKKGDEVICPAGQLLTLTAEEAARRDAEGRPLLAAGIVADVPAMLQRLGLDEHPIIDLAISRAEKVAHWISEMAPILMMLGFLGLYIEFKTPGFGLPGIAGIICLALFYWGHHIAGLAGMEDLVLLLIGVILLAIEFFVIPGFGIAGILGILFVWGSMMSAMVSMGPTWADLQGAFFKTGVAIVGAGIGALILGRFLPESRLFRRLTLTAATNANEGYTAGDDTTALIGQTGVTLTALHPSGTIRVGDKNLDVITHGEFLDIGTPVQIIEAHGNRILVARQT